MQTSCARCTVPVYAAAKGGTAKKVVPGKKTLAVLSRVQKLKLLSKVEESGLLELAERSGLTLQVIEEQNLLSKAQPLLGLLTDTSTPGKLTAAAFLAWAAAIGLIVTVPDETTTQLAAQALGGVVLVGAGAAAFAGGSLIGSLQRVD